MSFAFAGRTSPATKHFTQQRELVLANANNVGATVAPLLAMPVRQRDKFWFEQRNDLNLLVARADRCLEKLIVADVGLLFDHAIRHNVLMSKCTQTPAQGYANRSASLCWALSVLLPSDIGRIHEFLATGQYIRDHLGEDRRSGPPLYSRLKLEDQACLAGLLMVTTLSIDDVNCSLDRLEANTNTATTDIGATTMLGELSRLLYELARLPAFDTKELVPRQKMLKVWSDRADKLNKQQYAKLARK